MKSSRRTFLEQAILASGIAAMSLRAAFANDVEKAARSLRILILGGTGFIGPHHVRAAVARGHQVAVFNRGKSSAELPKNVERLVGDRMTDLHAIANRDWDAVIDLQTYVPSWVRSLAEALKGRAKHYTFMSTNAVYAEFKDALSRFGGDKERKLPGNQDVLTEDSALLKYEGSADPYGVSAPKGAVEYGSLKAVCEDEVHRQFPRRSLILRPSFIFGPGMSYPPAAFYWQQRLVRSGEAMVAGDPSTPIQFVDVRDLAAWVVQSIETQSTGIYNVSGSMHPLTLEALIDGLRSSVTSQVSGVTWVPSQWLAARPDRQTWSNLLFWTFEAEGGAPFARVSSARAIKNGFLSRPATETFIDIEDYYRAQPPARQAELLAMQKPTWNEYLAQEQLALAAWREASSSSSSSSR